MVMMIFSTIMALHTIDDHLLHTAFTTVTFPIAPPTTLVIKEYCLLKTDSEVKLRVKRCTVRNMIVHSSLFHSQYRRL